MVRDPLSGLLSARKLLRSEKFRASSINWSSNSGFQSSCNATVSIMDGAVRVRGLYLAVRWGCTSLMHMAAHVVCRLYLANEQLRVRARPRLRAAKCTTVVAGYTSLENNERKHFPGSFLHPNKLFLTNKLLSAYIFTFCFFCDGQSSMGSSLSQPVRDNSGHSPDSSDVSPDSSDAASVANVLDGTDAAESGGEPSGADAAGGAGECAIAGASCDNCGGAVIHWSRNGGDADATS